MTQIGESPFTRDDELRLFALKMAAGDRMRIHDKEGTPVHVDVLEDARAYYAWLTEKDA